MENLNKYLFLLIFISGCCSVPVTRYSSSIRSNGLSLGIDLSYGKLHWTEEYQDSLSEHLNNFPIAGFNLNYKRNNLTFYSRFYWSGYFLIGTLPFPTFPTIFFHYYENRGTNLGLDYYFKPFESSPFIGFDFSSFSSKIHIALNENEYNFHSKGYSTIWLLGYSYVIKPYFSINTTMRTGASFIVFDGNKYTIPEVGVGINAFIKLGFLEIAPELFLYGAELPSDKMKFSFYPGIYLGIRF
ncbi:hypothetical protein KAX08_06495 [candidate division WOR-3 bacterium]|nr:hypothetical protein [candidate division WOR-3 bacterium]